MVGDLLRERSTTAGVPDAVKDADVDVSQNAG